MQLQTNTTTTDQNNKPYNFCFLILYPFTVELVLVGDFIKFRDTTLLLCRYFPGPSSSINRLQSSSRSLVRKSESITKFPLWGKFDEQRPIRYINLYFNKKNEIQIGVRDTNYEHRLIYAEGNSNAESNKRMNDCRLNLWCT